MVLGTRSEMDTFLLPVVVLSAILCLGINNIFCLILIAIIIVISVAS